MMTWPVYAAVIGVNFLILGILVSVFASSLAGTRFSRYVKPLRELSAASLILSFIMLIAAVLISIVGQLFVVN